jgi:hypothetical protein
MNRFTKTECLSLFTPKENTNIDYCEFELGKVTDYPICNELRRYHDDNKQLFTFCDFCDCECNKYYCDSCDDVLHQICKGKKLFSIKLKYKYTPLVIDIPIFGMTGDDKFVSIHGDNITTLLYDSSYMNFKISKFFSKDINPSGECTWCPAKTNNYFCDNDFRFYKQLVDKLYDIYLILRHNLIDDLSREIFLDIYLSYAILLNFH